MTHLTKWISDGYVRSLFYQTWRYVMSHNDKFAMLIIPSLFFAMLLLFHPPASATTIVLIRTQSEIFAGADSKGTNEYAKQRRGLFCKIHRVGDLMFAVSGVVEDKVADFSVSRIVAEAARRGGTIDEIAARIDDALVQPLYNAVTHFKEISPDVYMKYIEEHDGVIFQLVLFRFEKGVPVVYEKNFGEPDLASNTIPAIGKVIRCPGEHCEGDRILLALGSNSAINEYLTRNPPPPQIELAELIRKLITLQIEASPHRVGHPIDLLRYDKTGIHWIQRKPECEY